MRNTIYSVTNFLYVGEEYLLLHRSSDAKVDANKLNGIGGKLENGENFLDAAIRETKEETGYTVSSKDVTFCGITTLKEGYPDDWVMCVFTIAVPTKVIPLGEKIKEGNLFWIHKDDVLKTKYTLVDDLHYLWKFIVSGETFFSHAVVGGDEKIKSMSVTTLPCS